mmetsp:Transcript_97460/g.274619  ORF Transcript_97460/g.274619 Transcript_97460/m.274619 type:complete len:240 (+) Transcript_97460:129-848(+)
MRLSSMVCRSIRSIIVVLASHGKPAKACHTEAEVALPTSLHHSSRRKIIHADVAPPRFVRHYTLFDETVTPQASPQVLRALGRECRGSNLRVHLLNAGANLAGRRRAARGRSGRNAIMPSLSFAAALVGTTGSFEPGLGDEAVVVIERCRKRRWGAEPHLLGEVDRLVDIADEEHNPRGQRGSHRCAERGCCRNLTRARRCRRTRLATGASSRGTSRGSRIYWIGDRRSRLTSHGAPLQ